MKKQSFVLITMLSLLAFAIVFTGCKEDEPTEPAITGEALFSYTAEGQTVTFTNESTITGTVTYAWTFGDGTASTAKDPIHTYEQKGEYTVTMTATDQNGKTYPVSTKVKVDKATRIALDDDSFDDWNAVTGDRFVVNVGDNSGVVVEAKFDYDANHVYVYAKWTGTLADENIFSVMLDTDNDSVTGMSSFLWPSQGGDFLIEGQPIVAEPWFAAFNYTGAGGSDEWSWEEKELNAESLIYGTSKEEGGNVMFEYAYVRDKIPNLTNDEISLGIYISNTDWLEIGFIPDMKPEGSEENVGGFYLDMR